MVERKEVFGTVCKFEVGSLKLNDDAAIVDGYGGVEDTAG